MEVLKINGVDYSHHIKSFGVNWSREDYDSNSIPMTKAGFYRRNKIATKRTLSYELMNMTRKELADLDTVLNMNYFTATYKDLHGTQTREFFSTGFSCKLESAYSADGEWGSAVLTIRER